MVLVEGNIEFSFDATWSVLKWDGHDAYVNGIQCVEPCKAADFCGIRERSLFLIEVKDFRGHRIENKKRLQGSSTESLAHEVAIKVRDTVAGIVGARRSRQTEGEIWEPLGLALGDMKFAVRVVLWLEEDLPRKPIETQVLQDNIKKKLRWLTTHVQVCCMADAHSLPPGVGARNLPGAGQRDASHPAEPPWHVRLAQKLQAASNEMGQLLPSEPELGPAKAELDRALAKVRALSAARSA